MPGSMFPLEIQPRIPTELARLKEMANDLMYTWDRSIRSLFHRLDRELWEQCGHNPKAFLRRVSQHRLDEALKDRSYMEDYRRVTSGYDSYLEHRGRPELTEFFDPAEDLIAYFCLEFGFHESFPIYSGGLGILAGDHCKAASDVGLPFVAIGLLYDMGYFTQTIDGYGHQQVTHTRSHPHDLPVVPTLTESGQHLTLELDFPDRIIKIRVWTARAGHIKLYLLDTNIPDNSEQDRTITHQLYGGDREMRLQQELVLGVGGVRALRALGLRPSVWHINEGHAAFQLLERCANRMQEGLDSRSAMELVAAGTVFTTHTPVPAGHDIFDKELMRKYWSGVRETLGADFDEVYALGGNGGGFNMTTLALRCTRFHNGVSRIHGQVASEMEAGLWRQIPHEENPITHVTNGVHLQTFLAREWASLFDLRFDDWRNELLNEEYWDRLDEIPDYHYWSIHKALKQQLMRFVHQKIIDQQRRNGTSDAVIHRMVRHVEGNDGEDVLVMGFARRFATYKRAGMLFADPERLARVLNNAKRPGVIIFAGKAHPHDHPGQELIKQIHDYSVHPDFIGKIILLEGYDMSLARLMVAGVDVWLNTPEYPLEASGTSGQKAGLNGAVNLSVLDGWWAEGYNGENGWGITPRDSRFDHEHRFIEEANDLLNIIEHEVLPCYYKRAGGGYSPDWVQLSKASMKSTIPRFNAQRMLMDYVKKLYWPARQQRRKLEANGAELARTLAAWKQRVRDAWYGVSVELMVQPPAHLYHDEHMLLKVRAQLNGLQAADVKLECLLGRGGSESEFVVKQFAELPSVGGDGEYTEFELELSSKLPGLQYYKLRIYPYNEALSHPFELGCMIWI